MPAKLERCVKAVKAKGSAMNSWTVCKVALAKAKKKREAKRTKK